MENRILCERFIKTLLSSNYFHRFMLHLWRIFYLSHCAKYNFRIAWKRWHSVEFFERVSFWENCSFPRELATKIHRDTSIFNYFHLWEYRSLLEEETRILKNLNLFIHKSRMKCFQFIWKSLDSTQWLSSSIAYFLSLNRAGKINLFGECMIDSRKHSICSALFLSWKCFPSWI